VLSQRRFDLGDEDGEYDDKPRDPDDGGDDDF